MDKAGDSGEVAKLIERLREAIVHYQVSENYFQHRIQLTAGQVSQQQAIYDRITDLAVSDFQFLSALHADNRLFFVKSSFDAFLKLHEVARCDGLIVVLADI